ncbi:MAG: SIS domain-containing protein [Bdellovibrionales bacterium]|nr:SIS domain-containing protein [Bdellovibrionales bacterium]
MSEQLDFQLRAESFSKKIHLFKLGHLVTEQPHPKTKNLRKLFLESPADAIRLLVEVERDAYQKLENSQEQLMALHLAILTTWSQGGRVFLCGCGATGRLSLLLETLWRQENPARTEDVQAFMAGGDYALVRSIENFEDFPEYGAKQLLDSGFTKRDLLIGSSEGGETPFVIGAVEAAADISLHSPFFVFCNPSSVIQSIERSRRILENPKVRNISLEIGPMALSGSTRLQATSCLTFFIGMALLTQNRPDLGKVLPEISKILTTIGELGMEHLIATEVAIIQAGGHFVYKTETLALTVLTDLTERSPTFSLRPIENEVLGDTIPALVSLEIPSAGNSMEAWKKTLAGRSPRPLKWNECAHLYGIKPTLGFDFSKGAEARRSQLAGRESFPAFEWDLTENGALQLIFGEQSLQMNVKGLGLLGANLCAKLLLNCQSLGVMAYLGRYEENIMIWVRPTNGKLIERALRYVKILWGESPCPFSDKEIVALLFEVFDQIPGDQSVVVETVRRLKAYR